MRRNKAFSYGAAVVASALILTGCNASDEAGQGELVKGEWEEVVAAAEEEGVVSVYSGLPAPINAAIKEEFEKVYPDIEVDIVRLLSSEIEARLQAERETGIRTADLAISVTYEEMLGYAADGDLYDAVGPNATDDRWIESGGLIDGSIQMTSITGVVLAWNTDLVSEPPTDIVDLLDERFEGLIGMPTNTTVAWTSFWAFLNDLQPSYWDELAALDPKFYDSAVPLQEALTSGEIGATMYAAIALLKPAIAAGAPIEYAAPAPMWGPQSMAYMPNWSPTSPNAAQVLFDWLASEDGQTVVNKDSVSVLDVPGTLQTYENTSPVDLDTQLDPTWVEEQQAEWRDTFDR